MWSSSDQDYQITIWSRSVPSTPKCVSHPSTVCGHWTHVSGRYKRGFRIREYAKCFFIVRNVMQIGNILGKLRFNCQTSTISIAFHSIIKKKHSISSFVSTSVDVNSNVLFFNIIFFYVFDFLVALYMFWVHLSVRNVSQVAYVH